MTNTEPGLAEIVTIKEEKGWKCVIEDRGNVIVVTKMPTRTEALIAALEKIEGK